MNDNDKLASRAEALQKLATAPIVIGALASLTAAPAGAAATMAPKLAAYQSTPKGGKQCSTCNLYVPAASNPAKANGTCKLVKGPIAPTGWCKFYSPKP